MEFVLVILGAAMFAFGVFTGAYLYYRAAHNEPPTPKILPQAKHKVIAAKRDEELDE